VALFLAADPSATKQPILAQECGAIQSAAPSARLIAMNACFRFAITELLRRVVGCVVGIVLRSVRIR